jgi:hypothetical protein
MGRRCRAAVANHARLKSPHLEKHDIPDSNEAPLALPSAESEGLLRILAGGLSRYREDTVFNSAKLMTDRNP